MKRVYLWIIYLFSNHKPDGSNHWRYMSRETKGYQGPLPCAHCRKTRKHRRYMLGLQPDNKDIVLCIWHYFERVPAEVDKIFLKLNKALGIAVVGLVFICAALSIPAFTNTKIFLQSPLSFQQMNNIIDWAYQLADGKTARSTIRTEIETITQASPNLVVATMAIAVVTVETGGTFNPATKGMMRNKNGKLVPSGAMGPGGVVPRYHREEMKRAGCQEDTDLFDPVLGTRTMMYCLQGTLAQAQGDTTRALKLYLQGAGTQYEHVEWNMSLEEYFNRTVNYMGKIAMAMNSREEEGLQAPVKK
jgi:hypothetical protein